MSKVDVKKIGVIDIRVTCYFNEWEK